MLGSRRVLLAKIESTYNTDPTPVAGTDDVLVENLAIAYEGARMHERPATRPSLGKLPQVFGGALVQLSFDVEIKGSGTIDAAPEMGPLLRACGFGQTINASTSVVYEPVSSSFESVTIWVYHDGQLWKVTGCRGNVEFSLEAGAAGKASFTITGHSVGPIDVALATPTYDSTVPPTVKGGAFTVDGFSAIISKYDLAMNNQIATPPDISATDGFGEIQIAGRDVSGSIDPENELVAAEAFDANWRADTPMVIATGVMGSSAGNRYKFDNPVAHYREVGEGDRDGISTQELAFGAHESSGDDEITITFT